MKQIMKILTLKFNGVLTDFSCLNRCELVKDMVYL